MKANKGRNYTALRKWLNRNASITAKDAAKIEPHSRCYWPPVSRLHKEQPPVRLWDSDNSVNQPTDDALYLYSLVAHLLQSRGVSPVTAADTAKD